MAWYCLRICTGKDDGTDADADQALHGKPRAEAPVAHSPALVDVRQVSLAELWWHAII